VAAAVLLFALQAAAAPLTFSVRVENDKEAVVTISGQAAPLPPGPFRGAVAVNGSPVELPVSGTLSQAGGVWRLPVTVRFADVPADWVDRFRPDGFAYRLKGSVGATAKQWSGRDTWKNVETDGGRDVLSEFLALEGVHLTEMNLLSSEAVARLEVRNPFAFDLKIAQTAYTLSANGRVVGEGATRGLILHARQKNVLTLPIEIDHAELLSAAGQALLAGGEVDVRLNGRLVLRLKEGDLVVPLDLSGHLTDAP
jgi:LEA14-like dessication related protein